MRSTLLICVVILSRAAHAWNDFVFDLDDVLIYKISDGHPAPKDAVVIDASGARYWLAHGAAETLELVSHLPDARISFMSTGVHARNVEALQQIRLADGRTAYDLSANPLNAGRAHRIFSREELYENDSRVKDLTLVGKDVDLQRAVLIDDQDGNAAPSQKENLLYVPTFGQNFDEAKVRLHIEDLIRDDDRAEAVTYARKYVLERNKSVRIYAMLKEALDRSHHSGRSLTTELHALVYRAPGKLNLDLYQPSSAIFRSLLAKVLPDYLRVNPKFGLVRLTGSGNPCASAFAKVASVDPAPANVRP